MTRWPRFAVPAAICGALLVAGATAFADDSKPSPERYAGSFMLESGEVITGGPFIERAGDALQFLYFDTDGLEKLGLFERKSDYLLKSNLPPETLSIEFIPGPDGELDEIIWTGPEGSQSGHRVFSHSAQAVTVTSTNGANLSGRLLVPDCPGPHPLVVMVGGSGPTTRWGGVFDTFFIPLGMAAFIYDKRGVGDEDWFEPDLEVLAADAAAAVRKAASLPGIDPQRIGIWASSQGGWVAPMAAREVEIDFLLVRVGPGVSELEAILHETRQEDRLEGLTGMELDNASALRREIYGLAIAGKPLSSTDALVEPYLQERWYQITFGDGPISENWSERWWRWAGKNMLVEPGPSLRLLDVPILWFLAEEDENVPLVASRFALEQAFAASPGRDETLIVLKGVNHAFLESGPGEAPRYTSGYFNRMEHWLAERELSNEACWSSQSPDL